MEQAYMYYMMCPIYGRRLLRSAESDSIVDCQKCHGKIAVKVNKDRVCVEVIEAKPQTFSPTETAFKTAIR